MRRCLSGSHVFFALLLLIPLLIGAGSPVRAQATISCDPDLTTPPRSAEAEASPMPVNAVPFPENPGVVTIFAAASLTDVFSTIERDLEAATPGLDLIFNFAGSQALVTQLVEGAEADLFASANNVQMAAAIEGGVIDGQPSAFASNRLAIVVPADNPAGITGPADLAKDGVQLVLADETVPVGVYARESICLMGADAATYGDNFVDQVAANIVSNETNVRNVLAKVQLGEADAGIVYITDITRDVANAVTAIEIPAEVNRVASYPVAPVLGGNADNARAFITYLLSEAGQATLQEFGFQRP
jgi:molybdate transport system substrate-binding protein